MQLITSWTNEQFNQWNSYLHILSFTHYIINIYKQETMKITNHMNTKIFTWKPSDWEENHGSFY